MDFPTATNVNSNDEVPHGYVRTPITGTLVHANSKWSNRQYRSEHQRWYRHNIIGLKNRPTWNPDGTLYRSTHPNEVRTSYYTKRERYYCEVCDQKMYSGFRDKHLMGQPHQKKLEELQRKVKEKIQQLYDLQNE